MILKLSINFPAIKFNELIWVMIAPDFQHNVMLLAKPNRHLPAQS